MPEESEQLVCPLCGFQFRKEEARATVCQRCPLRGGCRWLVKCPNCGYEIPQVAVPSWLRRLLSKVGGWVSRQGQK